MKLSIIITSWNTSHLLNKCLHSLYQFPPQCQFEIIVVDNASTDGSADMVAREFPDVRLLRNSHNAGFAGGNNQGAYEARGEYILLLGSDTEVFSHSIQTMVDVLNDKSFVGAVSCKLIFPDGRLQHSCKRFPTVWNAIAMYLSLHFFNQKYLMHDFDHNSEREVDQPDATCIMIRREIIQCIGLFDVRFSILYNDVELCRRINNNGWKIFFTPQATIVHHGSQSTKQAPALLRAEMYRNILLYYRMTFGRYAEMLLLPILFFRLLFITRSAVAFKLFFSKKQLL